jgi:hypothetical protein
MSPQGQLILPLSAVHYFELAENPRDEHRERAAKAMALLSRFKAITCMSKIVDEELALALNKRFGRPAFPVKVPKLGVGVWFALKGESKGSSCYRGPAIAAPKERMRRSSSRAPDDHHEPHPFQARRCL